MCTTTLAFPKALYLTDDEALALLDLGLSANRDLNTSQEQALLKIGEFYREGLRREIAGGEEQACRHQARFSNS